MRGEDERRVCAGIARCRVEIGSAPLWRLVERYHRGALFWREVRCSVDLDNVYQYDRVRTVARPNLVIKRTSVVEATATIRQRAAAVTTAEA